MSIKNLKAHTFHSNPVKPSYFSTAGRILLSVIQQTQIHIFHYKNRFQPTAWIISPFRCTSEAEACQWCKRFCSSCESFSVIFNTPSNAFHYNCFTKSCCPLLTKIIPLHVSVKPEPNIDLCVTLDKSPPFHLSGVSPFWRKRMFCAPKQLTWAAYKNLQCVAPRRKLPTAPQCSWHHVPAYWCAVWGLSECFLL